MSGAKDFHGKAEWSSMVLNKVSQKFRRKKRINMRVSLWFRFKIRLQSALRVEHSVADFALLADYCNNVNYRVQQWL